MSKVKSELSISREGKVGKLAIVGEVGWDWFGVSYITFRDQLKDLGDVDIIEVEIDSPGGIVTDGVAIFNALRESEATIHTYVSGHAASIASVILMAGDKMFIPDNAMVFVHKPLNMLFGNADDMRKMADDLDKFEGALINSYMRWFNGTEDEMKSLMSNDTWLTAEEMSDKFNGVTVLSAREEQAVAKCDVVAELGTVVHIPKESTLDKAVNALRNKTVNKVQDHEEVDMTPEQMAEFAETVATATASAVAEALNKEPEVPEDPPVENSIEIEFEGDIGNLDDVQAHADKVALAELKASADMTTTAGVMAYHKALAKLKGEGSDEQRQPASSQSTLNTTTTDMPTVSGFTKEQVQAASARMTAK